MNIEVGSRWEWVSGSNFIYEVVRLDGPDHHYPIVLKRVSVPEEWEQLTRKFWDDNYAMLEASYHGFDTFGQYRQTMFELPQHQEARWFEREDVKEITP